MTENLRTALDKVKASDALKNKTARFLQAEISKREKPRFRLTAMRFAAAGAALLLIAFIGFYFTPSAYVDMDVNPSVGLTLNRFNRVVGTEAYNNEGAEILARARVRFKTYDEAAQILLGAIIASGYLADNGLVSVTVQANGGAENVMLNGLTQAVSASLTGHHAHAQTDIYAVTGEVKACARENNISPAKYLAITELQEVDPTATFEGCMGNSISELHELAQQHAAGQHGGGMHGRRMHHD